MSGNGKRETADGNRESATPLSTFQLTFHPRQPFNLLYLKIISYNSPGLKGFAR
jgi:hypothetical protein